VITSDPIVKSYYFHWTKAC